MAKISSNLSIAGSVSSSLSQAASGLSGVQNPSTFAECTNVSGNSNARKSGTDLVNALHKISDSIAKDGNNIHSVAQEFAAIDQKIKNQLDSLSLGGRLR